MKRYATLAALIPLLAACNSTGGKPDRQDRIEVTFTLDVPSLRPVEGELAGVTFRIRNVTGGTVILRDLTPAGSPGSVLSWQFARTGSVKYVPGMDEWIYDRRQPGKQRPVFNSGLLAPGETVTARARIRLLQMPKRFKLAWYELSPKQLKEMIYFGIREGQETRYRPTLGGQLEEKLVPDLRPDASSHRVVIFPHAEQVTRQARVEEIRVEADLQPRPFTLKRAVALTGGRNPDAYTYTTWLDGWILQRGNDVTLVTAVKTHPLPRLLDMERVFHYLDTLGPSKVTVEFLRETKTIFAGRWRIVPDPESGRFYLFLPREELLKFLADVLDSGLALDAHVPPRGGGRLLVTR